MSEKVDERKRKRERLREKVLVHSNDVFFEFSFLDNTRKKSFFVSSWERFNLKAALF